MEEPYGEGVANHTGPESCAGVCEDSGEALIGVRAGRVLSREIPQTRVPALCNGRKATPGASLARDAFGPCAPPRRTEHVRKHLGRESGDPIADFWRRV
jgi:hypothetical protein